MSKFKRAVSWLFHSEEYETVQDTFDLTDQQMEDAAAVAEFLTMIMPYIDVEHAFDMFDEVHEWSKK